MWNSSTIFMMWLVILLKRVVFTCRICALLQETMVKYMEYYIKYHTANPEESFREWTSAAADLRFEWEEMDKQSLPQSAVLGGALATPW
jgi:hypothetical protein